MKRGFDPPRPAQSVCKLCDRLFAYFQRTKRRMHCDRCVEIERQAANAFFNELARRNRLHARTIAEEIHA
jgi:hypothetical protein